MVTYDCLVFALLPGGGLGGPRYMCGVLIREDAGERSDSGESMSVDTALLPFALVLPLTLGMSDSGGGTRESGLGRAADALDGGSLTDLRMSLSSCG